MKTGHWDLWRPVPSVRRGWRVELSLRQSLVALAKHGGAPEYPMGGVLGGGQGHGRDEVAGEAGGEELAGARGGAVDGALVQGQLRLLAALRLWWMLLLLLLLYCDQGMIGCYGVIGALTKEKWWRWQR